MRIVLVQPDDTAARSHQTSFEELGYDSIRAEGDCAAAIEWAKESKPQVVLVFLDILPDAALELCATLDADRLLRSVPLLFAGGAAPALNRAQETYPRASFTRMEQLQTAIVSLRSQ